MVDYSVIEVPAAAAPPRAPAPAAAPTPPPPAGIESRNSSPAPGDAVELRIVPASLAGAGWTWRADAGAVTDLGGGRAGFRVPEDAAAGTVYRVTATAPSASGSGPAREAVIGIVVR